MATATKHVHKRIGILFDFDDTLAPDSYGRLLKSCGIDHDQFEQERVQPLIDDGWDRILAKMYCLVAESQREGGCTITKQRLLNVGRDIPLFDGVPNMFDRVRSRAQELVPDVEVEFYILSSGIVEIAEGIPIADQFKEIWGGAFHYDDQGAISAAKRIISHPEKVRYVLQVSKGVSEDGEPGRPSNVYRDVADKDLHIPLSQIIYLGDGASDMPVFRLLNEHFGIAIGLFKGDSADNWEYSKDIERNRRVQNLAPVDYRNGSELMQSLLLSVERICNQIALHELSVGE